MKRSVGRASLGRCDLRIRIGGGSLVQGINTWLDRNVSNSSERIFLLLDFGKLTFLLNDDFPLSTLQLRGQLLTCIFTTSVPASKSVNKRFLTTYNSTDFEAFGFWSVLYSEPIQLNTIFITLSLSLCQDITGDLFSNRLLYNILYTNLVQSTVMTDWENVASFIV